MNKIMMMAAAALMLAAGAVCPVKADLGDTAELSARKYAPYPYGEIDRLTNSHYYRSKDCDSTGHIYTVTHLYDRCSVAVAVCYIGRFNVDDVDHFLKLNKLPLISDYYWHRCSEDLEWVSEDGNYYLGLISPMVELRDIVVISIQTAQAHNATPAK